MFRILLADDEKVTRRGLAAILQRGLKEEIECLEATNGQKALEIIREHTVDMVVTDICMPLCSGLEFIKQLRSTDEDMTVFIISGYENFEYAKQAVKLGVKDYIMKPVNKEDFLCQIENCIADIKKKQMDARKKYMESRNNKRIMFHLKQECILQLLDGSLKNSPEAIPALGLSFTSMFYVTAAVEYEVDSEFEEQMDFIVKNIADEYLEGNNEGQALTITYRAGCLAVILEEKSQDSVFGKSRMFSQIVLLIEKFCKVKAVIGVGDVVYEKEKLYHSFHHARQTANMKIYDNRDRVFYYNHLLTARKDFLPADNQLYSIGSLSEEEEIVRLFEKAMQLPHSLETVGYIQKLYIEVQDSIEKKLPSMEQRDIPRGQFARFDDIWSFFALRREVRAMIQHYKFMVDTKGEGSNNRIVQEIIQYTVEHITEDIDLNYLAEHFSKTPGYISTLFRKGNNMGFNEFVTSERMKLAQRLLRNDALSIQKVGQLCGYYNPKYFSVVFKKTTGISPKAYRQLQ